MKELKDGILYDTDQAKLLNVWEGYYRSIDGVGMPVIERFYQGKSGRFFKHITYTAEKNIFWKVMTGNWHDSEYLYSMTNDAARNLAFSRGLDVVALGFDKPSVA